jgi:hypothetical protein
VPTVSKEDIAYGSYLKIRRSHEHFQTLQRRVVEFAATEYYSISTERNPDTGQPFVRVNVQSMPEDIPLIIGDVVHNLRSALDILWNTMIRRLSGDDGKHYFPAFDKREHLEGAIFKTDKVVVPTKSAISFLTRQSFTRLETRLETQPSGASISWTDWISTDCWLLSLL